MSGDCSKESLTPTWVSIAFGSLSMIMLIVTVYISMSHLKKPKPSQRFQRKPKPIKSPRNEASAAGRTDVTALNTTQSNELDTKQKEYISINTEDIVSDCKYESIDIEDKDEEYCAVVNSEESEWEKAKGFKAKLKLCAKDVWRRKAVYLPIISHLSDTCTDFAAVVEFGIIAAHSNPDDCGGLNVKYLFALSISCMAVYRMISSYKIYEITGSISRVFTQFIDIEIYRVLYIAHYMGLKGTSSPQRLLSTLEAVFEAAPQSVIQMVYLMFTNEGSAVIIASCVFSFANLTSTITSDDSNLLDISVSKKCEFVLLRLYRLLDIPSKILSYCFWWYFVSGYACVAIVSIDIVIAIILYLITKNTDALLSIVAVPFTLGEDSRNSLLFLHCWSVLQVLVMNGVIWYYAMEGEPNIFDEDSTQPEWIAALWLYCTIGSLLKWCFQCAVTKLYKKTNSTEYGVKSCQNLTKERNDVEGLLTHKQYQAAFELIIFKESTIESAAKTQIYGNDRGYSFLSVAVGTSNETLVNAVWNASGGLDNYWKPSDENSDGKEYDKTVIETLKKLGIAEKLYTQVLNTAVVDDPSDINIIHEIMYDIDERREENRYTTALMVAIENGDKEMIEEIMNAAECDVEYMMKISAFWDRTALCHAEEMASAQLFLDKIAVLLSDKSGTKIIKPYYEWQIPSKQWWGRHYTLLAYAVIFDHKQLYETLIQNFGLDDFCDVKDFATFQEYRTALWVAAKSGKKDYIKSVMNLDGVNMEYINHIVIDHLSEKTALALAIETNDLSVVKCFIEGVQKVLSMNHEDVYRKRVEILNNLTSDERYSSLKFAVKSAVKKEIFEFLLSCYSPSDAKEMLSRNSLERSCDIGLSWADDDEKKNKTEIKEFIQQKKAEWELNTNDKSKTEDNNDGDNKEDDDLYEVKEEASKSDDGNILSFDALVDSAIQDAINDAT